MSIGFFCLVFESIFGYGYWYPTIDTGTGFLEILNSNFSLILMKMMWWFGQVLKDEERMECNNGRGGALWRGKKLGQSELEKKMIEMGPEPDEMDDEGWKDGKVIIWNNPR